MTRLAIISVINVCVLSNVLVPSTTRFRFASGQSTTELVSILRGNRLSRCDRLLTLLYRRWDLRVVPKKNLMITEQAVHSTECYYGKSQNGHTRKRPK